MTQFFVAVLILIFAFLGPLLLIRGKVMRRSLALLLGVVLLVVSVGVGVRSALIEVRPGRMARVYGLTGKQWDLRPGYNYVAPWDRVYEIDTTVQYFEFYQEDYLTGVETAANDVFGAQSKDADYIYALAKISVRVDPDRVENYIERYGPSSIGQKLQGTLKDELKASLDAAFKDYGTEELMSAKAQVAEEAAQIARERLKAFPIIVEHLEFPDFDAGESYEDNIRLKADIRMRTEQALLNEELNEKTALADKALADGAAAVALVRAQNDADIKLVAAQNEAAVNEVEAANAAKVASIKAENDAQVRETLATADAQVIQITAEAEAAASLARSEAEAKGAELVGAAYQNHLSLLQLEELRVMESYAQRWNGLYLPSIGGEGGGSLNFMNLTGLAEKYLQLGLDSLETQEPPQTPADAMGPEELAE